ncbi:hypothetical protein [Acidisoma sp. C75]
MVTFSRAAWRGFCRPGLAALLLLALSGCAGAPRTVLVPAAAPSPGARLATVAAIRPVPGPAAQSGGALLAALGLGGQQAAPPLAEVLVRTDDGETLSVVAPAGSAPALGSRVVISAGDRLSLVRPGFAAPAS